MIETKKKTTLWVWIFSGITLFLCTLSYTEGDIFYATEGLSFWNCWARNMMGFSYTFELFYILAILLSSSNEEHFYNQKGISFASNILKKTIIYSMFVLVGVFITNLIAYLYASLINGAPLSFVNIWPTQDQSMYRLLPIMTAIILNVLIFLRLIFYGLAMKAISLLIKKKIYVGFAVMSIFLVFIGFDAVFAFSNINIFPYQYAGSDYQEMIFGNNIFGHNPIQFGSAVVYFILIISVMYGIIMIIKKHTNISSVDVVPQNTGFRFREDIVKLLKSRGAWFIAIILLAVLPFIYFLDWFPRMERPLDNAFSVFDNAFASSYLLNYLLPLLSVAILGLTMWKDVHTMIKMGILTGKKYIQKALISLVSAGIVVIFATFGAMAISLLTAPNTGWDWGFTVLFMLRLFLTSCIFAAIGFGILALTNNEVAAMAIPILYTNYALGGIYHIAGCKNIGIFQKIMPQILTNRVMESISAGYENIISAAIVAIVLLVIGYMKLRKKVNQE